MGRLPVEMSEPDVILPRELTDISDEVRRVAPVRPVQHDLRDRTLAAEHHATPDGVSNWPQLSPDFLEGNTAIIQHTTGNLTNVRSNAKFDFGVAMLPANKQRGSPTGGGNFYLFKKSTPAQREAAFKFIKWVTTPQRAAQWGIDTGYVAVRADAWAAEYHEAARPLRTGVLAGFTAAEHALTALRRL